jgi:hypothetical protein
MPTYTKDDGSATAVMDQLVKLFHQDLSIAGVTVEILHAHGGLKHHGYNAAAVVKVKSLADRAAGSADARIVVDGDGWEEWDRKRRQAVIDHELEHLEPQYDDGGELKRDDLGRPKLKLKLHDWHIGGFECIAQRNKEHALEAQQLARTWAGAKQLELDWDAAEMLAARGSGAEAGAV